MCTFSYKLGFINEKHVQTASSCEKSRCPWDKVHLRTSVMFQTDGKPSTTRTIKFSKVEFPKNEKNIFGNQFFWKIFRKWPLPNIWSQMEIYFPLSSDAHTQLEWHFNRQSSFWMWYNFISCRVFQTKTSPNGYTS